jgi:ElaB/YqjD/DUF883 family membrane-anchored ribosome-binding protein
MTTDLTSGPATGSATEQLKDKVCDLSHHATELVGLARDAAGEKFAAAKEGTIAFYRSGMDKLCALKDDASDYVHENPVKSMAIAAGVGALIGTLLMRRR